MSQLKFHSFLVFSMEPRSEFVESSLIEQAWTSCSGCSVLEIAAKSKESTGKLVPTNTALLKRIFLCQIFHFVRSFFGFYIDNCSWAMIGLYFVDRLRVGVDVIVYLALFLAVQFQFSFTNDLCVCRYKGRPSECTKASIWAVVDGRCMIKVP